MNYEDALKLAATRLTKLYGRVVTPKEVEEEDRIAFRNQLKKCYEERMQEGKKDAS
jgi:hypothetical protein